MRKPTAFVAIVMSLALAGFGLLASGAPALAQGQGAPPYDVAMLWTINGGESAEMIHDTGHTNQADIDTGVTGNGLEAVNPDTISGVTYFQIEDGTNGLCMNEGNAPAIKWESCPVDSSNELIRLAGTNGNELEFKADSEYVTAASLSNGALLSLSSTSTPSAENQFLYTNPEPGEETLGVDFTTAGASSADWTTIADEATPSGETRGVVFEVCDANGDCGDRLDDAH